MKRLVLALSLLAPAAARADVLFLNDGRELTGVLTRADAAAVYLSTGGREVPYPRADVLKASLVRQWRLPGEDSPQTIVDPALRAALRNEVEAEDYPDDGQLIALDDGLCVLGEDRRSRCSWRRLTRVLRERGKDRAANVRVSYLEGVGRAEIDYARAVTDGKVSYLDDTSVEVGSDFAQYPGYDRQKSVKFAVPDVSTSSWIDYRTREEAPLGVSSQPYAAGSSFRSFEPALLTRFAVIAPKGLALRWSEYKMPKDARFTREEKGRTVRLAWETGPLPSIKSEDSMPPFWRIAPQVTVAPADTWERLAAELSAGIGSKREAGPELAAKAAELIRGLDTDERRAEALYNWVARGIKHENVGMRQYSYLPKDPRDILAAKAGDSLDKPFLLYVLLRAAGLRPQLVYIGSKEDMPFDKDLPTLTQFCAAVVRLELGGRERFLTPFDDSLRWDAQPGWLQGQEGLVVDGPGLGRLVRVPQAPAEDESLRCAMKLALDPAGGLAGDVSLQPRGWHQAEWRVTKDWKQEDVDKQFEKLVHGIHPNARLKSYAIDNLQDPTRDLTVRLSFAVPDYALRASGDYLAFRVPWTDRPAGDVGKPAREHAMFWFNRDRSTTEAEIALPKGYELYYAPQDVALAAAGCLFSGSYERRPGALVYRDEFVTGAVEILPEDYPKYKSLREDTARFTQRWIVLRKRGSL